VGDTPEGETPRSTPAGTFDVPTWLADLSGHRDWQLERTFTRRKVEFVTNYTAPQGGTAQITMRAVPAAANASWELRADIGPIRAGVVIPAHIRVKW
jgi:hypothetical protein